MAKSRNRGGAKAHRKKVQKRNEKLGIQKKQFQKAFTEMYTTKLQELKEQFEKMSATTENSENVVESVENATELNYEETISTNEKTEESGTESQSSSSN